MQFGKIPFLIAFLSLTIISFFFCLFVSQGSTWSICLTLFLAILTWLIHRGDILVEIQTGEQAMMIKTGEDIVLSSPTVQLHIIAGELMQESHETSQLVSPVSTALEGDLLDFAREIAGDRNLPADRGLTAFFTDDAIAFLETLPNRYWFWRTICDATYYHPCEGFSEKINLDDLKGVREVNRGTVEEKHGIDLHSDSWVMNDEVSSFWQALGIILYDPGKQARVFNPAFQPEEA